MTVAPNPAQIEGGRKLSAMAKLRSLLSTTSALFSRSLFARSLGTMMNGERDIYTVFGWNASPTFEHFWYKYHKQGLAKRIIDMPADGIWTDPPQINAQQAFLNDWNDLANGLSIWEVFHRLDVLCGLGMYAVLLVGFDDGRNLEQPITPDRNNLVLYLQPYSEGAAKIDKFNDNVNDPRFGLPEIYLITPGDISLNRGALNLDSKKAFKVHHTRVLHIAENVTDNAVYGHSRMESCYNTLDDLLKVIGGSAETYWLAGNRGLQIDVDKDMELSPDDAEALADEIDEYSNQLRRVMRTRGTKINNIGSDLADPKNPFTVLISDLSGSTGIPQRILLGAEAGQLASQQDRANWAQRLSERIKRFVEPRILVPFIRMMIHARVLREPRNLVITWPDAFKLNPLERGQASAQMARSAANIIKALSTPIALDGSGRAEEEVTEDVEAPETTDPITGKKTPGGITQVTKKIYKPSTTVMTVEEARRIIAFGTHAPVFDTSQDVDAEPGTTP